MRSASSAVIRGRFIWPLLLERLQWPFLARPTQLETVPIAPRDLPGQAPLLDIVLRSPHAVTTYKRGHQADPSILEIDVDAVFEAVRRQVETRR